jgi:hypothetical protein
LKVLAVPFGSDFLSRDVDRAVVVLDIAVVLVSFDGAPYLACTAATSRHAHGSEP